ncbi:winged helix DNA-binding domain-containing protein [Tessaracoccus defluvii]|uniref:Winged helix DNA-binding domain-containing protein n=1 Tax=Tessaracoccus defluvii TaxID=1285901 RepID=A0A7H0H514_9ACTN|nr:winged helix DNA-binding domain-containing protein [Tessaracoccus defluvii]
MTAAFPTAARRSRLARRHALTPGSRRDDVVALADDLVAVHSTDPATVYLSLLARMQRPDLDAVERALYTDRALVRHHSLRRTLWVASRPMTRRLHSAATLGLLRQERRRTTALLADNGIDDPERWIDRARLRTLGALAEGPLAARELGRLVPELNERLTQSAAGSTGSTRGPRPSTGWGRRSRVSTSPPRSANWRAPTCARSAPSPPPTCGGGPAGRRRPPTAPSPPPAPSRSTRTPVPPGSRPATRPRTSRSTNGSRFCRRWTRPSWGGRSGPGTSPLPPPTRSTASATAAPPSGSTASSWAPGLSGPTGRSASTGSRTCPPGAAPRWRTGRGSSKGGWGRPGSRPGSPARSRRPCWPEPHQCRRSTMRMPAPSPNGEVHRSVASRPAPSGLPT